MMDQLAENHYRLHFKNEILLAKGNEFEALFQKIMKIIYQANFVNCIPYGIQGDKKCDGFLVNERTLFQVYAPTQPQQAKLVKKAQDDFNGAIKHWGDYFDKWVLVYKHHYDDGLSPDMLALFLSFKESTNKQLEIWGADELLNQFHQISPKILAEWYGEMPTRQTDFGFGELQEIFTYLMAFEEDILKPITPIYGNKIRENNFDMAIASILKSSFGKVERVTSYFDKQSEGKLGDRASKKFKDQYEKLKAEYQHSDVIFFQFEQWLSEGEFPPPRKRLAIDTVIAYFFEKCDIFEEPKGNT